LESSLRNATVFFIVLAGSIAFTERRSETSQVHLASSAQLAPPILQKTDGVNIAGAGDGSRLQQKSPNDLADDKAGFAPERDRQAGQTRFRFLAKPSVAIPFEREQIAARAKTNWP